VRHLHECIGAALAGGADGATLLVVQVELALEPVEFGREAAPAAGSSRARTSTTPSMVLATDANRPPCNLAASSSVRSPARACQQIDVFRGQRPTSHGGGGVGHRAQSAGPPQVTAIDASRARRCAAVLDPS
jgi:hypothetical protein